MIIMKFGGASTSNAEGVRRVSSIVGANRERRPVVVVSAMGKTTRVIDHAVRLAVSGNGPAAEAACREIIDHHVSVSREVLDTRRFECARSRIEEISVRLRTLIDGLAIVRELSPRSLDACLSLGEQLASAVLSQAIDAAAYVPASEIFITDNTFTRAAPSMNELHANALRLIAPIVATGTVALTEGYVGATRDGEPTTMGMESSDLSATLLGAALGADEVQIWTNVDGIMTIDPGVSPQARTIPVMTYDEAEELAMLGAKILHPRTIGPARKAHIPITVRNSASPDGRFTRIHDDRVSANGVKAIAVADHLAFRNSDSNGSKANDSVYVFSVQAGQQRNTWHGTGEANSGSKEYAAISLVGNGVGNEGKILATVLECTGDSLSGLIAGASALSMSVIVQSDRVSEIVEGLHRRLFQ